MAYAGLGGADWFEVAGRLAQAETDIGLGRIVEQGRNPGPGAAAMAAGKNHEGVDGLQTSMPLLSEDDGGKVLESAVCRSGGAVFGPPSPPLKRHAAPLFKAGKSGPQADMRSKKSNQEKDLVELEDMTSEYQKSQAILPAQEYKERSAPPIAKRTQGPQQEDKRKRLEDGTQSTTVLQEGLEPPGKEQSFAKSAPTESHPIDSTELVGVGSPGQEEASLFRDWSQPSPGQKPADSPHTNNSPKEAKTAPPIVSLIAQTPPQNSANAPPSNDEDNHSIWQFNKSGPQDPAADLERRGSLQMEELARASLGGGQEQGGGTPPLQDGQLVVSTSAFGALAKVPGWNLALGSSLGQRVASFVEDVVAASATHEQRFVGRLRSNSSKDLSRPTELQVMNGVSSQEGGAELAGEQAVPELGAASVEGVLERGLGGASVGQDVAAVSNADWLTRVQSATTQQLGGWLARVRTTYRGSKEDIGWLQREPGSAPVTDGTERFLQLLGQIVHGIHSLSDEYVYLLTPGLFSNFGPLYLHDTKKYLAKLGLSTHIAKIHSEAAVEKNALEICQYVEELNWGTNKQVVILGHSKGGIDACAALALYPERLAGKVRGVALVQSPYAGNPVCSDILREGQVADFGSRAVLQALMQTALKGELRALEDMTYEHRRAFIRSHPLPQEIPLVSFHTEASRAPTALSTITTVGHAELPLAALVAGATSSAAAQGTGLGKLPIGVPIGATLATIAGHLELRYGEKSDGLVTRRDAEVPGSVVVRPEKKLDHAWPVFGTKGVPGDPEPAQVNEALLTLLLESQFTPGQAPVVRQVRSGDPPRRWR